MKEDSLNIYRYKKKVTALFKNYFNDCFKTVLAFFLSIEAL